MGVVRRRTFTRHITVPKRYAKLIPAAVCSCYTWPLYIWPPPFSDRSLDPFPYDMCISPPHPPTHPPTHPAAAAEANCCKTHPTMDVTKPYNRPKCHKPCAKTTMTPVVPETTGLTLCQASYVPTQNIPQPHKISQLHDQPSGQCNTQRPAGGRGLSESGPSG